MSAINMSLKINEVNIMYVTSHKHSHQHHIENKTQKQPKMPDIVLEKIFGPHGLKHVDNINGSMLPYTKLKEIPGIGKARFDLGYAYQKLKKGHILPFSLFSATLSDGTKDVFVHVPSKKNLATYPGLLGKGWYADTEIAQNLRTREWVAVKRYKHKNGPQKIDDDLVQKEMEVLKILNLFKGYTEHNGKKNIYMKLFDGKELRMISKNHLPKKLSSQIQCAISAIRKLEILHQSNWIHGDIHRGNIIINTKNNSMQIIDFNKSAYLGPNGKAKVTQGGYPINIPGKVQTTLDLNASMELDKYTDRFALGTTLAYMFSGKKHPVKNGTGYIKTLLFKPQGLNCLNEEWKELQSCLELLTEKDGPDDLDFVCQKLHQLRLKLENRGA